MVFLFSFGCAYAALSCSLVSPERVSVLTPSFFIRIKFYVNLNLAHMKLSASQIVFPVILLTAGLLVTGCSGAEKKISGKGADTRDADERTLEEIRGCIEQNFPASKFITNEFLPKPGEPVDLPVFESLEKVMIGLPWIHNDEAAALYIAKDKGYFREAGLEVEFLPAGPGVNSMLTLASGVVDIVMTPNIISIVQLMSTPTGGGDFLVIATLLKHSPHAWITLDDSIPKSQRSTKKLTPQDLIGKSVGVQGGTEIFYEYAMDMFDLPPGSITLMKAGNTPELLMLGRMDFFAAWLVNQPRMLEDNGFYNWVAFSFVDYGLDEYTDISVVRKETAEERPGIVRGYAYALHRAVRFMLDNPEEGAEITARYATDSKLSVNQILRRFELQYDFITDDDGVPLLHLREDRVNELSAVLLKYGKVQIPGCM